MRLFLSSQRVKTVHLTETDEVISGSDKTNFRQRHENECLQHVKLKTFPSLLIFNENILFI